MKTMRILTVNENLIKSILSSALGSLSMLNDDETVDSVSFTGKSGKVLISVVKDKSVFN